MAAVLLVTTQSGLSVAAPPAAAPITPVPTPASTADPRSAASLTALRGERFPTRHR